MKCFDTNQESQECKTQETNQILQNNQNRFGNAFLNQMLSAEVDITGYASPEWNNPKGESPEELNESLAWERADSIEDELEYIFQSFLSSPSNVQINNHGGIIANENGNDNSSPEQMRKAEISVLLNEESQLEQAEEDTISEECFSTATDQWAIKLKVSGGAGHKGIGGAFAIGVLKNRRTGEEVQGMFLGGGFGAGLASPGVDPGWGSWTNFTTEKYVTFEDFQKTSCRLNSAGGGIAIIGHSRARLSFPDMGEGAQEINVSGWNMGAVGLDGSTNIGVWKLNRIPKNECSSDFNEETASFEQGETQLLQHSVYFERGSSEISSNELHGLNSFMTRIA